jgi:hypothetical protein
MFLCYQRAPRRQFIPIQASIAGLDAISVYVMHEGSALFACPPGDSASGYCRQAAARLIPQADRAMSAYCSAACGRRQYQTHVRVKLMIVRGRRYYIRNESVPLTLAGAAR